MAPSLPGDWHEVEEPDYIVEKYRAENPTLFVREGHDVGVHVLHVSTSSPHDDERYRAGAIVGHRDEFESEEPIETYDDREDALDCALRFANEYESAYGEQTSERDALAAAVDELS
ncbi:MAG: hypothetical protein ABEH83_13225 [Halobacterium sp.]